MPRLAVTLPAGLLEEVRARVGRGGLSSWIAQAAAERLSRERLAAALAEYEADAGLITDEDIATAKAHTAWKPTARRREPSAASKCSTQER